MRNAINLENLHDELNSILNPKSKNALDVLAGQESQPPVERPSGHHDLSEFPLDGRPTDLKPIPEAPPYTPVESKKIEKHQEDYKVNPLLVAYVLSLLKDGHKKLGPLKFDLDYIQSEKQLRQTLKNSLHFGHINEQEYDKMIGYLGEPEIEAEEPKEIDVVPQEVEKVPLVEILPEVSREEVLPEPALVQVSTSEPETRESITIVELTQAREKFVQAEIEYKRKSGEHGSLVEIKKDLGFGQTSEKSPKELELEEAKKELEDALAKYNAAKKQKMEQIVSAPITPEEKQEFDIDSKMTDEEIKRLVITVRLIEQEEEERDALRKLQDLLLGPEDQKSRDIIKKGLEKWPTVSDIAPQPEPVVLPEKPKKYFDGIIGKPKPAEPPAVVEVPVTPEAQEIPVEDVETSTKQELASQLEPVSQIEGDKSHIQHKDSFIDVINEGDERVVKFNEQIIADEKPFGAGKILVLDDRFQDGQQYGDIREAFAIAFEKNTTADQIGDTPTAIPFESGKIYVVLGFGGNPNSTKVLLNGKEIASSLTEEKGAKIQYDSTLPKSGFLFSDNVYERAFNQAKKFIKTLK